MSNSESELNISAPSANSTAENSNRTQGWTPVQGATQASAQGVMQALMQAKSGENTTALNQEIVLTSIRFDEKKIHAFISIEPNQNAANKSDLLTADFIYQKLGQNSIEPAAIDPDVVQNILDEWNKNHLPIAEREIAQSPYLPQPGSNARIEYIVDPNLNITPNDQTGNVDFKNLNLIKPVIEGQPLARKHPATKGAAGIDLFGQPSEASDGEDIELPIGPNTEVSKTEPNLIIASVAGFLQQKDDKISVDECFVVNGPVDYSTGNITYEQSAMIHGDIADGFTVKVGGALEVGGAVGEAKLIVGGNILIKKGFVGSGNGLITAKGSINLGFASNQTLRGHGDILLVKEAFNCQISSRKSIFVFGPLVGGQSMAGREIKCRAAGNEMGTKTELEAGMDYILHENKTLLELKLKDLTEQLAKINLKLKSFREVYRTRKHFSSEEAKLMLELRDMHDKIQAYLPELEKRRLDINDQIRKLYSFPGIRIHVEKKVYPGVVIRIGSECIRVQEEMVGPKIFAYQNGRIKVI